MPRYSAACLGRKKAGAGWAAVFDSVAVIECPLGEIGLKKMELPRRGNISRTAPVISGERAVWCANDAKYWKRFAVIGSKSLSRSRKIASAIQIKASN